MRKTLFILALFISIVSTNSFANRLKTYWQQDVKYDIDVKLDTKNHTLTGKEILVYTNNSPDTLYYIWFHTYPNAFKNRKTVFAKEMIDAHLKGEWGADKIYFADEKDLGYMELKSVKVDSQELRWEYKGSNAMKTSVRNDTLDETETKVFLNKPLLPKQSVTFEIEFFVKIPIVFSRLGHSGRHYEISQWYPKPVVYDDLGWHPDGYHIEGEFYGEFGTFDVKITLPKDLIIDATGDLISPESEYALWDSLVLESAKIDSMTNKERKKYLKERRNKIEKAVNDTIYKTVHFHAENVHDFAFFADSHYIMRRGKWKDVDIRTFARPENERLWKDAVKYTYDGVDYYSKWYGEYPYKHVSVVSGYMSAGGGMEYPTITVISGSGSKYDRMLESTIVHEVGHNWFYGILGSNEMDEAWLDEGMNSFSDLRYTETKYKDDKSDIMSDKVPPFIKKQMGLNSRSMELMRYRRMKDSGDEKQTILTVSYKLEHYFTLTYTKSAYIMDMLKDILGDSTFDKVMQTYYEEWKFKHPHTEDFIEVAERVSGKELKYFFDQWLRTTKSSDFAITKVEKEKKDGKHITTVEVKQNGEIQMPVNVEIMDKNGNKQSKLCELNSNEGIVKFETEADVKKVQVAPNLKYLDTNYWNNQSPKMWKIKPFLTSPDYRCTNVVYGFNPWYQNVAGIQAIGWVKIGNPTTGFNNLNLSSGYSFASKNNIWSVDYKTHYVIGKDVKFNLGTTERSGVFKYYFNASFNAGRSFWARKFNGIDFNFTHHYLHDIKYFDKADWQKGKNSRASIKYEFEGGPFRLPYSTSVEYISSKEFWNSNYDYDKITLNTQLSIRWTRNKSTDINLFVGTLTGKPPLQERFYLAGDLDPLTEKTMVFDRTGKWASPLENYMIGDWYGMSGYAGKFNNKHLNGKTMLTLRIEQEIPKIPVISIIPIPLTAYIEAGNVWNKSSKVDFNDIRSDVGIMTSIGFINLLVPFWVSEPKINEKNFDFRYILQLKSIPSIRRFFGYAI